jgi:hypothetical protein
LAFFIGLATQLLSNVQIETVMRLLLIIGGIVGFGIGLLLNWSDQSAWPSALWRACLTAYAAAILMKWWGSAWRKNLENALREREAQSEQTNASSPSLSKAIKS